MIMELDLNKAIEWAAGAFAREHFLSAEEAQTEAQGMRERMLGFGESRVEATRKGIEDGKVVWPYPKDESPIGSVPWTTVTEDMVKAAMTDYHDTPYGVLWVDCA